MKQLLLFLFLVGAAHALAQKEGKFVLALETNSAQQKIKLPFNSIKIIDARFDPVVIGSVVKDLSFKGITENRMLAVFPENAVTYIPKILDSLLVLEDKKTDTLFMLLKQFRIADHVSNTLTTYHETETILTLSCSFYKAEHGRLAKIFLLDNITSETWPLNEKSNKEEINQRRATAVLTLLTNVFVNRNWATTAASFPLAEVEAAIKKRLEIPLFTNPVLVPGIYKTFEEFKNNSPSITEIRIGRQNGMVREVQDIHENTIDIKNFWGLCDGSDRYLFFQQGIHRLSTVNNSFRFVFYRRDGEAGFKSNPDDFSGRNRMNPILPLELNRTFSKYTRDEFLYLNMENGKVHTEDLIGIAQPIKLNSKSN